MLAQRCADAHRTYSNYNTWVQASFVAAWLPHTDKPLAISSGAVKINETSAEDFVLTISWVKSLRFIWHLCKNVCKGESQCCPAVIVYSCYLWSVLLSFLRSCYHGSITYKKKEKLWQIHGILNLTMQTFCNENRQPPNQVFGKNLSEAMSSSPSFQSLLGMLNSILHLAIYSRRKQRFFAMKQQFGARFHASSNRFFNKSISVTLRHW